MKNEVFAFAYTDVINNNHAHQTTYFKQTAEYLGILEVTLRIWHCQGRGPLFVKVGSRVLYEPDAVRRYVQENTRCSARQVLKQTGP